MLIELCDLRLLEAVRVRRAPSWFDGQVVKLIRNHTNRLKNLNTQQFSDETQSVRDEVRKSKSSLKARTCIRSFAVTCEAIRRVQNKELYDVQILAGLALASGSIAEMETGEGKSLSALLPICLFAMRGHGAHVATANEYLAERDAIEMQSTFAALGLSCSANLASLSADEKQLAYKSDVTYGAGYEFGFDFLRDQLRLRQIHKTRLGTNHLLKLRGQSRTQPLVNPRGHHFAIIDEADSVLVDEATSPLVISSAASGTNQQPEIYRSAKDQADQLVADQHFVADARKRTIRLTRAGWDLAHRTTFPYQTARLRRPWTEYILQALHAKLFFARDVDFVVQNQKIVIVDQNTGRLHPERTWREGLHQAVEAQQSVPVTSENPVDARLTRQRYFKLYQHRCGLTGTAMGAETELSEFFGFEVVRIPRNKPRRRELLPSRYFADESTKFDAVVTSAQERHLHGQPVLLGTRTIHQSHRLSELMTQRQLTCQILNGLQDQTEADIIAQAGQTGQITIATNMAGRGTDIRIPPPSKAAGGLHVIAIEHHASSRVDRQLIGRAGRQDDPGSAQVFVSGDDEIIATHDAGLSATLRQIQPTAGITSDQLDQRVRKLQARLESEALTARRMMVAQDHWLEQIQRSVARTG
jgi:preprotein translocase subunit SecA